MFPVFATYIHGRDGDSRCLWWRPPIVRGGIESLPTGHKRRCSVYGFHVVAATIKNWLFFAPEGGWCDLEDLQDEANGLRKALAARDRDASLAALVARLLLARLIHAIAAAGRARGRHEEASDVRRVLAPGGKTDIYIAMC